MTLNLSPVDRASLSLSYGDYLRFSQLMQERSGLAFPEKRRTELEIGVRRAFAASTCPDLDSYYHFLLDSANCGLEMERLINYLTIGESHFFRDAAQFDALESTVLPELIERRRSARTLRIWSAGCASGEEPYSIAMLLLDLLPDIKSWNITILGTDINTQHLDRAHRAVFSQWAFRETRAIQYQPRFFSPAGNQFALDEKVRSMVQFSPLNLAEDDYPSLDTNTMYMDLILCRNVTIYFPESVTRQVVKRFYNSLSDGGWFIIGHSEHALDIYDQFQSHNFPDTILYKRAPKDLPARGPHHDHLSPDFTRPAAWESFPPDPHIITDFSLSAPVFPTPAPLNEPKAASEHSACSPLLSPSNDLDQAQEWINLGKMDQARDALLIHLRDHPGHALACALLGKTYANLGNWPEAERWCQLAIAHNRLNLEAYYTLALVFQHQGRRDEAIEMMKKVIYIDRTDILGHFGLADMYFNTGQALIALKFLENSRHLLEARPPEEFVPRSGDITVDRLLTTVIKLQETWRSCLPKTAPYWGH